MNYTFLAAGIASLVGLWNQIKSLGEKLTSLFIEKVEINEYFKSKVYKYMWAMMKAGKLRNKKFTGEYQYLKESKEVRFIAMEQLGGNATFWDSWKPLFLHASQKASSGDSEENRNLHLSFIRGTFDIDKFLITVCEYDRASIAKGGPSNRYRVVRHFGKEAHEKKDSGDSGSDFYGVSEWFKQNRLVEHSFDKLGFPVPKSPFEYLCYSKELWNYAKYIGDWKKSREWYQEKGIQWRTGALFYGAPGTGKTSMARALAQHLNMPIHILDLTTMSNMELIACWKKAKEDTPCIVLLEDLDRVFDQEKNVKGAEMKCPLTMDGLLNCLSGIEPSEGIVAIVTANDVSKLDPALGIPDADGKSSRPGRLDMALKFDVMDLDCRQKLANRILSDFPEHVAQIVKEGENETGAQFSKRCEDLALKLFWNSKMDKKEEGNLSAE